MSAKINIETEDKALAATLGMVIARALEDAGFSNTMAKTIMLIAEPDEPVHFRRVNGVLEVTEPAELGKRTPALPALMPLRYTAAPETVDVLLQRMEDLNPGISDKPIVLSFYPATCETYEVMEKEFLTAPRITPPPPPPAPVTQGFGEAP